LGASIVASVVIYVLVSVFYEPKRNEAQMRKLTGAAVAESYSHFQQLFEASLPTAIFTASDELKPDFSVAFSRLLEPSQRYEVKGTSCKYASFRLHQLRHRPEFNDTRINLLLLDPTDDDRILANVNFKADTSDMTTPNPAAEVAKIKEEIYVTLYTLFDIRYSRATTVYLHHDLPFFRCEHFDDGVMLSYYVGQAEYHETLLFPKGTRQFKAYRQAKELTKDFAVKQFKFHHAAREGVVHDQATFRSLVEELGCKLTDAQLEAKMKERIASYQDEIRKSKLPSDGMF